MPKLKSGEFDQNKYVVEYMKENIKHVKVSLNKTKPDDIRILNLLNEKRGKASGYIKKLIINDMENPDGENYRPKEYPPTRYSDTLFGCWKCKHELSPGRPNFCQGCGAKINWEGVKERMIYKIKPEFLDLWEGGNSPSDPDRIISEDEVKALAEEWDTSFEELLKQLDPVE